ncbi:hypothetical protein, partial [Sphingorhabdus sp.]|uniref:hypothetical protein n=1 Tax=Sphingorhabdus sp. TaxID=1902408 RepID=UPI003BAFDF6A
MQQTRGDKSIMRIHPKTPIIVGIGQCVDRRLDFDATTAPSPQSLRLIAAQNALLDSGCREAISQSIDCVVAVRTMLDSVPGVPQPFGRCEKPASTIAAALGIDRAQCKYSHVGGDQPQTLVNEMAEAICRGEVRTVLLVGAEATLAMKQAARAQTMLDWSESAAGEEIDRGLGYPLLTAYELRNGLGSPTQTYPAFEHALRMRLGRSREAHLIAMSSLWSGFSKVAAGNAYAQFPEARSAEFLAAPSAENYPVADPYLKWHVAQDAVNQGAAVILTSVGEAERLGISPEKWIFLHGYAQARDRFVTERQDLSRSKAIELVIPTALEMAGKSPSDIQYFDLYSCFPCAVFLAAEALALDAGRVPLTVTGGLPFFGGAGNNYSMHAIVSMVEKLRADRQAYGLVLANGGFLSKEAAGIYSAQPVENWQPSTVDLQPEIDALAATQLLAESCEAKVETYTVTYAKGAPQRAYV